MRLVLAYSLRNFICQIVSALTPYIANCFKMKNSQARGFWEFRKLFIDFMKLFCNLDRASPSGEDGVIEGYLTRKHEWEHNTKKASNRSWDKVKFKKFEIFLKSLILL